MYMPHTLKISGYHPVNLGRAKFFSHVRNGVPQPGTPFVVLGDSVRIAELFFFVLLLQDVRGTIPPFEPGTNFPAINLPYK